MNIFSWYFIVIKPSVLFLVFVISSIPEILISPSTTLEILPLFIAELTEP
jgi:hypothetical protein